FAGSSPPAGAGGPDGRGLGVPPRLRVPFGRTALYEFAPFRPSWYRHVGSHTYGTSTRRPSSTFRPDHPRLPAEDGRQTGPRTLAPYLALPNGNSSRRRTAAGSPWRGRGTVAPDARGAVRAGSRPAGRASTPPVDSPVWVEDTRRSSSPL